MQKLTLEIL